MAIVAMAVYNTPENTRFPGTQKTIDHLVQKNSLPPGTRIVVVNNGSGDPQTLPYLIKKATERKIVLINNKENLGTAAAINQGWSLRNPGEPCVKMDDDCLIPDSDWLDVCLDALGRDPKLGMVGLKRYDVIECPDHPLDRCKTQLRMLPNNLVKPHLVIEKTDRPLVGTCLVLSGKCSDKAGGLYQAELYGYDDSELCERLKLIGWEYGYLPHLRILSVDTGSGGYVDWKKKMALKTSGYGNRLKDLRDKKVSLFVPLPDPKMLPVFKV